MGLLRQYGFREHDPPSYERVIRKLLSERVGEPGDWWATRVEAREAGLTDSEISSANIRAFNSVATDHFEGRWYTESEADYFNLSRVNLRIELADVAEPVREALGFYRWIDSVASMPGNGAMLSRHARMEGNEIALLEVAAKYIIVHPGASGGLNEGAVFDNEVRLSRNEIVTPMTVLPNHKMRAVGHLTLSTQRAVFSSQSTCLSKPWRDITSARAHSDAIRFVNADSSISSYFRMNEVDAMSVAMLSDVLLSKVIRLVA